MCLKLLLSDWSGNITCPDLSKMLKADWSNILGFSPSGSSPFLITSPSQSKSLISDWSGNMTCPDVPSMLKADWYNILGFSPVC